MKNIIFDWSGVVTNTVARQLWIVNKIFGSYGVKQIDLQEFRNNWVQPYALFYQKYLPKNYSEEEQAKMYREAVLSKDCPEALAYPKMAELIKKCKAKGAFLVIVSSDLPETLLKELKEYGLENVFSEIITNTDDKSEAVQKIIRNNKLDQQQTFFVGDSNHEIDVAKNTGIKSIAVTWGFTSEQKLKTKNPDYLVTTPQELEEVIL